MGGMRGCVHIYTGEGKGKTTAAVGLAVRAAGQGMKVLFVQFFKEDSVSSGEKEAFKSIGGIEMLRSNCRHPIFTKGATDLEFVKRSVIDIYAEGKRRAGSGGYGLVVFDEIMSAINGGWLPLSDVEAFLEERPAELEVVLTGRNAPYELVRGADYVTEMLKIKHPFDSGINARRGIEF